MTSRRDRGRAWSVATATAVAAAMVALAGLLVAAVPAGADEGPTLTVSPATGVLDRQPISVSGTGLPPGTFILVQCAGDVCSAAPSPPPTPTYPVNSEVVTVAADGTFDATVRIDRQMPGAPSCLEVTCTVRGVSVANFQRTYTSGPIEVAATGTYRWPQATLTAASRPVVDRGTVAVRGSGYDPRVGSVFYRTRGLANTEVCRAVAAPTAADCVVSESSFESLFDMGMIATGAGTVDGEVRVVRHLALPSGRWDCARQGCTLALTQSGDPVSNRVPLTWAPEWAPYASVDAFLDQVVTPVLGRAPTPAGRARLRAGLVARTTTAVDAVREVAASSVRDADVGEVVRIYRAFFDRNVETGGLRYWVQRVRAGMTPLQMARSFGGTPEFRARYAGLGNAEAVTVTYRAALGREPSAADVAYWRGRLDAGMSRADMVYSFARTPELRRRTARATQVAIVTLVLRNVAPTTGEVAAGPGPVTAQFLADRYG